MKKYLMMTFGAILMTAGLQLAAATGGNCMATAPSVDSYFPTSASGMSFTLEAEYVPGFDDMPGYYMMNGGCYLKLTLVKSRTYSFWLTDTSSRLALSLDSDFLDMSAPIAFARRVVSNGVTYEVLTPDCWTDGSVGTFYLHITGLKGATFNLHMAEGIALPEGSEIKPTEISVPSSGTATTACGLTANGGSHYLAAMLTAGEKYLFVTKGGTAARPCSLEIEQDMYYAWKDEGDVSGRTPLTCEAGNMGFELTPGETGRYLIKVSTATAGSVVSLSYAKNHVLLPEQHKLVELTLGQSVSCKPGWRSVPDSGADDAVIDECLFNVATVVGHRYLVQVTGATVPLRGEAYGHDGRVTAAGDVTGTDGGDLRIGFVATEPSVFFGVCQSDCAVGVRTPTYASVSVMVVDVDAMTPVRDEFDPLDDSSAGATDVTPVFTESHTLPPSSVDSEQKPDHLLSLTDWYDTYRFEAAQGFVYEFEALTAKGVEPNVQLKAEFYTLNGGVEVPVPANGLKVMPEFYGPCYLRLSVEDGVGLDYPPYQLRAEFHTSNALVSGGPLEVDQMGLPESAAATWTMSGCTNRFRYGESVYASGSRTLQFSSVEGYATPADVALTIPNGGTNVVVRYADAEEAGEGDDDKGHAKILVPSGEVQRTPRTLWADDAADWMTFRATAGVWYDFSFESAPRDAVIVLWSASGEEIRRSPLRLLFQAEADADYFIEVAHVDSSAPRDGTYVLAYRSVAVGTVSAAAADVRCRESDAQAVVTLRRSSAEGAVRVRWGTVAGTAKPGVDYVARGGEIDLTEIETQLVIPLLPEFKPTAAPDRTFFIRLESVDLSDADGDVFPATLTGEHVVTVTIADSGEESARPLPDASPAGDVESADTPLRSGTYFGALAERADTFADVDVRNVAGLTVQMSDSTVEAQLSVGEANFRFEGDRECLVVTNEGVVRTTCELTSGESLLKLTFETRGETAGVLDSRDDVLTSCRCEANLVVDMPGGLHVLTSYQGEAIRLDNARHTGVRQLLAPQTGRFTAALYGSLGIYSNEGFGALDMTLGVDGSVSGRLQFPNGQTAAFDDSVLTLIERSADGFDVFGLPILCRAGDISAAGMLRFLIQDGVLVVDSLSSESTLRVFGPLGCLDLHAFGGPYDPDVNLSAFYAGLNLKAYVDAFDDSFAVRPLAHGFESETEAVTFELDRETGTLCGLVGGKAWQGVLVQNGDVECLNMTDFVIGGSYSDGFWPSSVLVVAEPEMVWDDEDWGFYSTISFARGAGEIVGSLPMPISGPVGGLVFLPTLGTNSLTRAGYDFIGWKSEGVFYGDGSMLRMPVADMVLTAEWKMSGVDKVVDCEDLPMMLGTEEEDAPWFVQSAKTSEGTTALQSGALTGAPGSQESHFVAEDVQVMGRLTFDWATSCSDNANQAGCTLFVNGRPVETIKGETGWTQFSVDLMPGDTVRWTFYRRTTAASGQNCAWLDHIRFEPQTVVRFVPGEDGVLSQSNVVRIIGQAIGELPIPTWTHYTLGCWCWYDAEAGRNVEVDASWPIPADGATLFAKLVKKPYYVSFDTNGGQPQLAPRAAGIHEFVELPGTNDVCRDGYALIGWQDAADQEYHERYLIAEGKDVSLKALWRMAGVDKVVDCEGIPLEMTTDEQDAPWFVQDAKVSTGTSALRSGAIRGGQHSRFRADVKSAGTLTFDWACSCDAIQYASCTFTVNGEKRGQIGGRSDWSSLKVDVAAGDKLCWDFYRYDNVDAGENCAWLDNFRFERWTTVRFVPQDGGVMAESNVVKAVGQPIGELPSDKNEKVSWVGRSLEGWYWHDDASGQDVKVDALWLVPDGEVVLVGRTTVPQYGFTFDLAGGKALVDLTQFHAPVGGSVKLPGVADVVKEGAELTGWQAGAKPPYAPGASFTFETAADVSLKALWRMAGVDKVVDCEGIPLEMTTDEQDAPWFVQGAKVSTGTSALRSGAIRGGQHSRFRADVKSAGTLTFDWACSCDAIQYASCTFTVNGEKRGRIGGRSDWSSLKVDVAAGDKLCWDFYRYDNVNAGENCAWLDNFRFVSKVPVDFGQAVVTSTTTPAELGIVSGTFAAESAGSETLGKLVAWAKANAVTVAQVNAMTFTKDPATDLEKAYLLNCAPDATNLAAAESAFAIESFDPVTGVAVVSGGKCNGDEYGNGFVEIRTATALTETFDTSVKSGSALFFKAYLVK